MHVMVTGANGFVGAHLCSHLADIGHIVTAVVRRPGTAPAGTREIVVADGNEVDAWKDKLIGQETVIHLAARVHVMKDDSVDPLGEFRLVNSAATLQLARSAAEQNVGRFVFLSSIKVNGESTEGVGFTAMDEANPQDPYGVSKWEAEQGLRRLERTTQMQVVIVRTPLVYGPGVRGNFLRSLRIASRAVPLPFKSVRNRRTLASVWNLTDLLARSASESGAAGALVLAGDERSPSTAELFQTLRSAMGVRTRLFAVSPRLLRILGRLTGKSDLIVRLVGSLEVQSGSSSNGWGWEPPYSFEESIKRTVDWYVASENHGRVVRL